MKLLHHLLNSGWFRFLSAFGLGLIIHDPCPTGSADNQGVQQGRQADKTPRWGLLLYGIAWFCGLAGVFLNFSASLRAGSWLIGISITIIVSTALVLGHLKKW